MASSSPAILTGCRDRNPLCLKLGTRQVSLGLTPGRKIHCSSHFEAIPAKAAHTCAGRKVTVCQSTQRSVDHKHSNHSEQRQQTTRDDEVPGTAAPRSPFNTGSMDITTAGATASLCGHSIPAEKTIVVLRHGMTTWNEEQRIQAGFDVQTLSQAHLDLVVTPQECTSCATALAATADEPS